MRETIRPPAPACGLEQQTRAARERAFDVAVDARHRVVAHDRPHVDGTVGAVSEPQIRRSLHEQRREPIARVADGDDDRSGEATLPGAAEGRRDDPRDRRRRDAVGHHDEIVFAPPRACTRLCARDACSCTRRATADDPTNETRREFRDGRQRLGGLRSAVHDGEKVRREPARRRAVAIRSRGERRLRRRLEDERVAGGNRDRRHPQRNHRRES